MCCCFFWSKENHSIGEWFKKALWRYWRKSPFATIKMRSANCIKEAKGGYSNEVYRIQSGIANIILLLLRNIVGRYFTEKNVEKSAKF